MVPRLASLWTPADQGDLSTCVLCVGRDDLAGALHAVEGAPPADRRADALLLGALAARTRSAARKEGATAGAAAAEALRGVLGVEEGFSGDRKDFHRACNSFLHSVLVRRRGMPILLSCVWVEVGRRAGLAVHGIGLPGHFVVRSGGEPGEVLPDGVYADPFDGGALRTTVDLKRIVAAASSGQADWDDGYLRPRTTREIVERVLHNLGFACRQDEDPRGLYRAAAFVAALRPDAPSAILRRGQAAETTGAEEMAASDFTEVLERFPDSEEADAAELGLHRLRTGPRAN